MRSLITIVDIILQLYTYIIWALVIMSWLLNFNIINVHNEIVRNIWRFITLATEPVLSPLRRLLPNFGGLDLSPIVVLLLIYLIRDVMWRYIYPNVF